MLIPISHLHNLLEFARTTGINIRDIQSNIPLTTLANKSDESYMAEEELGLILREIIGIAKNPFFGLHFGCFMNIRSLGVIFEISKSASSIEQIIFILKAYLEQTTSIYSLQITHSQQTTKLSLVSHVPPDDVINHLLDASLCILYRELTLILKSEAGLQLTFPSKHIKEYQLMLGHHVNSGHEHSLSFQSDYLNTELSETHLQKVERLLPAFQLEIEQLKNEHTFSSQVKKMILHLCQPDFPTIELVARPFNISKRTFQRRLHDEGKTYRRLVNEVKKELFLLLQSGGRIKTKEMAYILGYAESSSFLHARKNWGVIS